MFFKWTFMIVQFLIFHLGMRCSGGQKLGMCRFPLCCDDNSLENKTNRCIACLSGYYGPNCTYPCRYPNYGFECQSHCTSCDERRCDPITGCKSPKMEIASKRSIFSNHMSTKTVEEDIASATRIFFKPYVNKFFKEENKYPSSIWTRLDLKHKVMLICTGITGALLAVVIGIFITKKIKKKSRMISLQRERNQSVTSSL